jgi:hypothetical protein
MTGKATLRALALGAVFLAATSVSAQDQGKGEMEKKMQEMQERTRQATSLGEHHEALAYFIGDWDVEMALVMPGVPRQASKGKASYGWIMEGRWVSQKVEGQLMGGQYESFSILGFDTYAKNHVLVTVSSMDTAMNLARGVVVDPSGKSTAVYGTLDEYTTGELAKPYKVVTRIEDQDHHVVEIWDLGIGAEGAQVLDFRYTRRKN